jgi:hypothetical protein
MFLLDLLDIILYFIYHLSDLLHLAEERIHEAIDIDGHIVHARIFVIALGLRMNNKSKKSGDVENLN